MQDAGARRRGGGQCEKDKGKWQRQMEGQSMF